MNIKNHINNLIQDIKHYKLGYFCLFASFSTLIYILFTDYFVNYPHQEVYEMFTTASFRGKPYLNFETFINIFDPVLDGGTDRVRFYNWIFWVFDSIFRFQLFRIIPFHPTISLSWIFTFFVLPFYLYKYLFDLTKSKTLSMQSVAFFFFTQGYLSLQTLYFHSAKPMSILGIIACMYYTQKLKQNQDKSKEFPLFIKLAIALILSLFWDEFFYIYFIIAPFIFPSMIKTKYYFKRFALLFGGAFVFFYFVSTILYPFILKSLFNYNFNFWDYAFTSNKGLTSLKLKDIIYNFRSLFSVHVNPFEPIKDYFWKPSTSYNDWVLFLFSAILFIPIFQRKKGYKNLVVSILSLLLFGFFQSLIVSRRSGYLQYGSYYWGSPFSLFFVIAIAAFWANYKGKIFIYLRTFIFIGLCIIGYRHNDAAAYGYLYTFTDGVSFKGANLPMKNHIGKISYRDIKVVWDNRKDMNKVREIMSNYPINAYWIYFEALLQNLDGKVKKDFTWYNYQRLKRKNIIK